VGCFVPGGMGCPEGLEESAWEVMEGGCTGGRGCGVQGAVSWVGGDGAVN
jgi:hypothetical protein